MLKSLQAGRALAALAVVAFHLHGAALMPAGSWLAAKSNHGNFGVDFFFVLSGFIILFAHQKDIGHREALPRYVGNRVRRVYPVYWVFTAAFVEALVVFGGTTPLPTDLAGWLSTVSLIRFSSEIPPLSVAWTLFYEIVFYGLFAVLIVNRWLGTVVMAAWALTIFAVHQYLPTNSVLGVWSSFICINFFIGMGACAAHSRMAKWASIPVLLLGVIGLIATGLLIDKSLPTWICQPFLAVCCGFIISGAAALETSRKLWFGPLGIIGNASYTLYLVHEHVAQLTLRLLRKTGVIGLWTPDMVFVVTILITVAVAVGLYLTVEKPLVAVIKRMSRPHSPRVNAVSY